MKEPIVLEVKPELVQDPTSKFWYLNTTYICDINESITIDFKGIFKARIFLKDIKNGCAEFIFGFKDVEDASKDK